MRGIYLPLLHSPSDCFRKPIIIAFWNFHFFPLVFADNHKLNNDPKLLGINVDNLLQDVYSESKIKTFTLFPLETSNGTLYPVKFLMPKDNKEDVLKKYLLIRKIDVNSGNSENPVICCDISETVKYKYDYLSAYFNNLRETFAVKNQFYDFDKMNKCCMKGCNANVKTGKNSFCKNCSEIMQSFES